MGRKLRPRGAESSPRPRREEAAAGSPLHHQPRALPGAGRPPLPATAPPAWVPPHRCVLRKFQVSRAGFCLDHSLRLTVPTKSTARESHRFPSQRALQAACAPGPHFERRHIIKRQSAEGTEGLSANRIKAKWPELLGLITDVFPLGVGLRQSPSDQGRAFPSILASGPGSPPRRARLASPALSAAVA